MSFPMTPTSISISGTAETEWFDLGDWTDMEMDLSVIANISGTPTSMTVALEGQINGKGPFDLAEHSVSSAELANAVLKFDVYGAVAHKARLVVRASAGGTTPSVENPDISVTLP